MVGYPIQMKNIFFCEIKMSYGVTFATLKDNQAKIPEPDLSFYNSKGTFDRKIMIQYALSLLYQVESSLLFSSSHNIDR